MKDQGACHCGAMAYEAEVDPGTVRICHCTDCQIRAGRSFRTNIQSLQAKRSGCCVDHPKSTSRRRKAAISVLRRFAANAEPACGRARRMVPGR